MGELGQLTDLKNSNPTVLKDLIVGCFNSKSEGTKTAAAYALGRLAVGNMTIYLPVILESIGAHTHQYLLLVALKEVIVVHANHNIDFTVFLAKVLPGLLGGCRAEEEVSVRTVQYCTVLYCTVLYCTVLYCTVLYCTVLYCTVLYCTYPLLIFLVLHIT